MIDSRCWGDISWPFLAAGSRVHGRQSHADAVMIYVGSRSLSCLQNNNSQSTVMRIVRLTGMRMRRGFEGVDCYRIREPQIWVQWQTTLFKRQHW